MKWQFLLGLVCVVECFSCHCWSVWEAGRCLHLMMLRGFSGEGTVLGAHRSVCPSLLLLRPVLAASRSMGFREKFLRTLRMC